MNATNIQGIAGFEHTSCAVSLGVRDVSVTCKAGIDAGFGLFRIWLS